ncbi:class F sortase [Nocardioides sp. zg-1228]|uniref:class F sortase n=1 Tax=Nocardioides sp. zg-1228 TaxID=2763008 RepID=UPI0016425FBB|nr:class F sortase [Nocardioides sp. zg-1228]MBC2933492.1 class F sortase [Nocardioides sp. zg-1228]QSF56372.1 class F sortase [Nocardioides sp. zg-1228]
MTRSAPGILVSAGLLLAAAGCAGTGPAATPPAADDPTTQAADPRPQPVLPARRARSEVSPRRPASATLPSGRVVPVTAAGTTGAGVLDVPDDVDVAGWWRGGSRIGDPFGSILLAAHVDSWTEGLGPFAEMLTTSEGARVRLEADGLRQDFEVTSRRLVPQGGLADDAWIYAAAGDLRLTLVTCAPPYDAGRGGYQNLAVVSARPIGPPETT